MFRQISRCVVSSFRFQPKTLYGRTSAHFLTPAIVKSYDSNFIRFKYVTSGVQGRRNSKAKPIISKYKDDEGDDDDDFEKLSLNDVEYDSLANQAMGVQSSIRAEANVLIIQPYIKWGPSKSTVAAEIKLQEAQDLIRSLDSWDISESLTVPLLTYSQRTLFGRGKVDELRRLAKKYNGNAEKKISCIFVSVSTLTQTQKNHLEDLFQLPVLDRFSVVIQILRAHAISREAKLQIALAEIPYIYMQMGTTDRALTRSKLTDSQKMMLRNRERKIKMELEHVRTHRKMVRKRRIQKEFPIVAVVGYTNAGKTSLIKALTNQEKIEPKNKLFATLEITAHAGKLPSNLEVIYMDTIGFMSDIPTDLIECFVATLEDAMMADLIIHVQDVAHINVMDQRKHVERTLHNLLFDSDSDKYKLLGNVINVGNKCDLVQRLDKRIEHFEDLSDINETQEPMHFISCTKAIGLPELKQAIERNLLKVTNRKKMVIRVPQGGEEMAWLYKNTAVTHTEIDPKNNEYLRVHVFLTELALIQFKIIFLKKSSPETS